MRAMTGVRTNLSPFPIPHTVITPSPLCIFPFTLLSILPSLPLSLTSVFLLSSSLPLLPGITLVDERSPVDKPLNSDQVTEGVQFAYTLPQHQSNQEDNDTALVGVHPCACVCMCWSVCVHICVHVCIYMYIECVHVVRTQ